MLLLKLPASEKMTGLGWMLQDVLHRCVMLAPRCRVKPPELLVGKTCEEYTLSWTENPNAFAELNFILCLSS